MRLEESITAGLVKRIPPNKIRAKSLFVSAEQAIATVRQIPLNRQTCKTILRELYEGLREVCEGVGYCLGFKFRDHESIAFFLLEVLGERSISKKFDRYRRLRNGINYYGNELDLETVREALVEIPLIIAKIRERGSSQMGYNGGEGFK